MGSRPAKPCAWPGCNALVSGATHCTVHAPAAAERRAKQVKRSNKAYNSVRDVSDARYKQEKWRRLSIYYRRLHPLCKQCELEGRVTASRMVDHIKPTKTHPDLFFDWSNLRALCNPCHNRIGEKVGLTGS
jgi:5-methylcytosine-specific restriction protein A